MKELAAYIKEFCEERDDCYFVDVYSGRFMYGNRCIGFTVYGNYLEVLVELCDYLQDKGVDCLTDVLRSIRLDEMGTGHIMYFPELQSEEDVNEGDL